MIVVLLASVFASGGTLPTRNPLGSSPSFGVLISTRNSGEPRSPFASADARGAPYRGAQVRL